MKDPQLTLVWKTRNNNNNNNSYNKNKRNDKNNYNSNNNNKIQWKYNKTTIKTKQNNTIRLKEQYQQ